MNFLNFLKKRKKKINEAFFKFFFFLVFILIFGKQVFALLITPEFIDFGRVKKFYQTKRYILFTNNSQESVEILGIVNACGLALKVDKKILKPKEITEGILLFDSGSPQGSFEEFVKIVFREGKEIRESKIKINWYTYPDKYPEIIIDKKEFNLGEILPKMPVTFQFEVRNTGNMILTVNAVIQEGFLLNLPVDIMPGETKVIKGSLVVEQPEKSTKILTLETNDLSNPKIELKFHYDARWEIKRGLNFYLENVRKTEYGYEIPIKISSKDYNISNIIFEDIDGRRLNIVAEKKILFKNDEGTFILRLDDREYEKLKRGKLYIKFGIPIEE